MHSQHVSHPSWTLTGTASAMMNTSLRQHTHFCAGGICHAGNHSNLCQINLYALQNQWNAKQLFVIVFKLLIRLMVNGSGSNHMYVEMFERNMNVI